MGQDVVPGGEHGWGAVAVEELEEPPLAIHAFVSQGFLYSTDNDYLARSSRGSFEFTDPKDNVHYPDCSLVIDDLAFSMDGERRGRTTVLIRENRS